MRRAMAHHIEALPPTLVHRLADGHGEREQVRGRGELVARHPFVRVVQCMVALLNRQVIARIDAWQAHIASEDGDADMAHVGLDIVNVLVRAPVAYSVLAPCWKDCLRLRT